RPARADERRASRRRGRSVARWRNVRRVDPCGICGKPTRAGMDYWLHRLADNPRPAPEIPEEPTAERAVPEDLDRVYRALLGLLSLSGAHREALLRRGLDEAAIGSASYRTLPKTGRAPIARELLDRFPARLLA